MSVSLIAPYAPLVAVMPGGIPVPGGNGAVFLEAITSLHAFIASEETNVSAGFLPPLTAVQIVATGLHDASRGEGGAVQKALDENFSCARLRLLAGLLPYVKKTTGLAFEVSQGEEGVSVVFKGKALRVAPPKVQFSVPSVFRATSAEAIAEAAVASYANSAASLSAWRHRTKERSRLYETLFANIAAGFRILGIPESGWQKWAARLTEQLTVEIADRKAEEVRSGKRIWRILLGLYLEYDDDEHVLAPAAAREFVKRYYLMEEGEFDKMAMRVPEEFRDRIVVHAGRKMLDITLKNVFVEWFSRTANELAIASASLTEAADFFGVRLNDKQRNRFVSHVMDEIIHSKASKRTGAQKMEMEAWRFIASVELKKSKWDRIRIALAKTWGVPTEAVDAVFHDIGEYLDYKAHVGAAILRRIEAHSSIGDSRVFIRNSAHKLRNALKESAEILAFLPGGSEIEHAKMADAIAKAVSRHNKSGRFEKVEIGKALVDLIGIDWLFADFSPAARIAIEKMGTALYFSNYYPHSHDLPQPLIEEALLFVAGMEKDEWDRIESHKGRAKRYRRRNKSRFMEV